MAKYIIGKHERGLLFENKAFKQILAPGKHWFLNALGDITVETVSVRQTEFKHRDLDVIIKSGALKDEALVLDLKDNERALVWIDGHFKMVLNPGLHAFWTVFSEVRTEIMDANQVRFVHPALKLIFRSGALTQAMVVDLKEHERAFVWIDGKFDSILKPGLHAYWTALHDVRIETVDTRIVRFEHADMAAIAKTGLLTEEATMLDLKANERALVWADGRFEAVLKPGAYALWTTQRVVKTEVIDASGVYFQHPELPVVLSGKGVGDLIDIYTVEAGSVGLYFKDGEFKSMLRPGTHAFWKGVNRVRLHTVDMREQVADISGQEIMTADKVTLRLNALVTYRVADALKAITEVDDFRQALYREAQLSLRATVGTRELDTLLSEKDAVAKELEGILKNKATAFGLEVQAMGIRDIILPGEMKDLMNKVTEARKAAEAVLITRREETAAMRMQANTAKILESNPTLMRIRELEVLEKISEKSSLKIVLGEKGLVDRVAKLL